MVNPYTPTYDVHASVQPDGRAERVNTLNHRTFHAISIVFDDHRAWRWLVVSKSGLTSFKVIDLWQTYLAQAFPYTEPRFIKETFDSVDQAIAYAALHLT